MSPRIRLALVAFFVCLCPQTANAQAAQIKGYAVQVAALSSRESAEELVRGLGARGINAYWVKGVLASRQNQLHRVRIGNFRTIESAYTYAQQLLGSGLLDAYAIAAYEPPAKGSYISNGKVQSFAQKYQGRQFSGETIDVIASIGTRGWLLLSRKSMNLTAQQGNSALSRELAKLAASVGSRGWGLNNNLANLLAAPALVNIAAAKIGIIEAAPVASASGEPSASRAGSDSLNTAALEVRRESLVPAFSTIAASSARTAGIAASSARTAGPKVFTAPPRLQGSIEMREGRMWMTLRNTDSDRTFSGLARLTLSDDKNQQDVTPMQFTLAPDKEESFPVDDATLVNGNWILMVYDENGAARLIRGASLAPIPSPQAPGPPNNPPAQGPPSYVTGVYDATGWAQPQASAPNPEASNPGAGPQNGPVPVSDAANAQDGVSSASTPPQAAVAPGPVTVTPRQIAVTTENVTLEFDISAPNPLSYIVVTLRAGDFQDTRQALMSTPQGRVPFLVPAEHASAGFFYEVKDEAQRVLASGSGDFRRIAKGN
ncbi:MAG: SPOR domain-containing protein [Blastocatellia bacterium]